MLEQSKKAVIGLGLCQLTHVAGRWERLQAFAHAYLEAITITWLSYCMAWMCFLSATVVFIQQWLKRFLLRTFMVQIKYGTVESTGRSPSQFSCGSYHTMGEENASNVFDRSNRNGKMWAVVAMLSTVSAASWPYSASSKIRRFS